MEVLETLAENSIQSIYLPRNIHMKFCKYNYAFVKLSEPCKAIVKLRLANPVTLAAACFLDQHVLVSDNDVLEAYYPRTRHHSEIKEEDIEGISKCTSAESVLATVIIGDVMRFPLLRTPTFLLARLIKDILELFVIVKSCIINLDTIPLARKLGISFIVVEDISGEKGGLFKTSGLTAISISSIKSLEIFTQECRPTDSSNHFKDIFRCRHSNDQDHLLKKATWQLQQVISSDHRNVLLKSGSLQPEKNILLIGSPGCGKTSAVQATATSLRFVVLQLFCNDLRNSPPKTVIEKLRTIFTKAKHHAHISEKCLILIKHVDLLGPKRNGIKLLKSQIILNAFIKELDGMKNNRNVFVIATTSSPDEVDPKLRCSGRLCEEIEIGMLSEFDKKMLLLELTSMLDIGCSNEIAQEISRCTPGFVFADLVSMVQQAKILHLKTMESLASCLEKAAAKITPTSMRGARGLVTHSQVLFSDIGGLEDVKKVLRIAVQWKLVNPEAFSRLGIPPTSGVLLCGPPGCAKTTLVRALAHETKVTFLAVSSADLYSPYVGESEKRLVQLFAQARVGAPAIIFIDEIDALVGSKGATREHGVQERILATMLVEMDGIGVRTASRASQPYNFNHGIIVVGATNRPELIDDALKRPGRFDQIIHIPLPDQKERVNILKVITKAMPIDSNVHLETFANLTEGCSGADLKNICMEAALNALTSRGMGASTILKEDFQTVLHQLTKQRYRLR